MSFQHHNWSGWPGAWCLDCGCEDPRETAIADGNYTEDENGWPIVNVTREQMECKEPGSGRFDPYRARAPAPAEQQKEN
jgi:hypothetical protein